MECAFNAGEIFEMAIRMETNGALFYRQAAKRFTKPSQSEILLRLAAMEDAHRETFEKMRAQLPDSESGAEWNDPDGEMARYLAVFVAAQVFDAAKTPEEFIRHDASLGEILIEAIGKERESILFYLGIREMAGDEGGGPDIDAIIREEMGHITLLHDHLDQLGGA